MVHHDKLRCRVCATAGIWTVFTFKTHVVRVKLCKLRLTILLPSPFDKMFHTCLALGCVRPSVLQTDVRLMFVSGAERTVNCSASFSNSHEQRCRHRSINTRWQETQCMSASCQREWTKSDFFCGILEWANMSPCLQNMINFCLWLVLQQDQQWGCLWIITRSVDEPRTNKDLSCLCRVLCCVYRSIMSVPSLREADSEFPPRLTSLTLSCRRDSAAAQCFFVSGHDVV